jgi:hypothetical protein
MVVNAACVTLRRCHIVNVDNLATVPLHTALTTAPPAHITLEVRNSAWLASSCHTQALKLVQQAHCRLHHRLLPASTALLLALPAPLLPASTTLLSRSLHHALLVLLPLLRQLLHHAAVGCATGEALLERRKALLDEQPVLGQRRAAGGAAVQQPAVARKLAQELEAAPADAACVARLVDGALVALVDLGTSACRMPGVVIMATMVCSKCWPVCRGSSGMLVQGYL